MKAHKIFAAVVVAAGLCIPSFAQQTRATEQVDTIVAGLKTFIPQYLTDEHIPGASVALIHGGKIVWTDGFGVANSITRERVSPQTLFEAASISKVVTAYMALRLVDEGRLSIDRPLRSYLRNGWLPPSVYADSITLRHVLSHTSGLSKTGTTILFRPGTAYYYSAQGFIYLKEVLEEITGEPFERLAQRLVFDPLRMKQSSFVRQDASIAFTSNGHVCAIVPVLVFTIVYGAIFFIVVTVALVTTRLRKGSWGLKRSLIIIHLLAVGVLTAAVLFYFLGSNGMMEFAWLLTLCGIVVLVAFFSVFFPGRDLIFRKAVKHAAIRMVLSIAWALLCSAAILYLSAQIRNVPVPTWPDNDASPAGTLQTSPQELALFAIEIANPKFLTETTGKYLRTPQIGLCDKMSWAMGPGILHSDHGYALWQWGQHIDFQSIMIIDPVRKYGIVVCTNNDLLNPDVALNIARRAFGEPMEALRGAIHLQYDHR